MMRENEWHALLVTMALVLAIMIVAGGLGSDVPVLMEAASRMALL